MTSKKIPIKYINNTGKTDFQVLVFSKNVDVNTPYVSYVAWEVIRAQSSAKFDYPLEFEVGASYEQGGKTISLGPFAASPGSTWQVEQESENDAAVLSQVRGVPSNPDKAIVIMNKKPSGWSGQRFDMGLYKSGRLLSVLKDVNVMNQADFLSEPQLYFAICRNMFVGKIFTSVEISTEKILFDLSKHPNGMEVTLDQEPDSGEYTFKDKSLI